MTLRLLKTKNGWLITTASSPLTPGEIAESHSFETMRALTEHLLVLSGEKKADTKRNKS